MRFSLLGAILTMVLAAIAADRIFAQPKPQRSPKELIAERDRLAKQSQTLIRAGKTDDAIPLMERKLKLERELLVRVIGVLPNRKDLHAHFCELLLNTLTFLADQHRQSGNLTSALKLRQEIVHHQETVYGKSDWRVTDARLAVNNLTELVQLTAQQRNELEYANKLHHRGVQLYHEGKSASAIPIIQQSLQIRTKILGPKHIDTSTSMNILGTLYSSMGDYAKAELPYQESLEISRKVLGPEHPDTAISLNNLGNLYSSMGDYAKAKLLLQKSLEINRKVLGREHPDTALSLNNLGSLYQLMGDYANAEPLHQKSLEINRKVLGPEHENTALSMLTLGKLYSSMGDYVKAESLYQKSLEINRKVLGPEHPDTATNLNDLGMLYQSLGDYANAEPLLQKSFEIRTKMLGPEHPDTATSLINLGVLYQSLGDYVKAESLYQKGLEINGKVLGQEHPNTATNLNNLGMLYQLVGDYIKAEPLLQKSFEISRKVLGQEHADTATSLNNLGALYSSMGDYVKAESLYQESLEIYMKVFGQEHPKTALGLNNLASLYQSMGEYTKAEPLLQKSLKIRTKILSKEHPYTAVSLNNLGYLYRAMGDYAKAEPYCRQSLLSTLNLLEQTSLVQSERQQLAMGQSFRFQLDSYLTLALEANQFGEQAFRKVLAWKGATLVRQRQLRKVADEEETAPLFAKLQQTATRLSTLALRVPDLRQLAVWKRQIDELSAEKERLEVELSRKSAAFRDTKKRVTLETLLAALPQDTVLIDFLEYDRSTFDKQKKRKTQFERSLVAFVIRKGQPIEPIDLGPVQPVEKDIDAWRTTFGATAEGRAAALSLRKRIWQPLEAQLAGAKTILVSPDGVLGRLPLAALPGKTKGKYLIEEYRIATIPVPQLLPALMKRQEGKELVGGLLLLGDVDYDADPQSIPKKRRRSWHKNRSTAMVRGERSFDQLDATAGEIAAIKELFTRLFKPQDDEIKTLSRTQSTEAIFRKAAPGYYNLHLATHGFFADPTKKSATKADPAQRQLQLSHQRVTGHHPGLLSGLAFAGANRKHDPDKDDGILTAEEIVTIRLDGCDLVVLSACETGLGKVAGGEGLLGVQRAFQVAGARSTVASLWKVDDAATRQLMERFYRNYWEREMGKLEALREAQLWMLRERGSRGLTDLDQDKEIKRLPPFYWAAFVLSGDWR